MTASLIASSIARALILPPFSLFLLIGIGWILHRRWPRLGRVVMTIAFSVFFVLCTAIGANLLVRPLEDLTQPLASTKDTSAQAIVVLAAGRIERAVEYGGMDIPDYIAL